MTIRERRRLSRRELVVAAVTIVGGGVALRIVACARDESKAGHATALTLPTAFTEIESLREVGRKYCDLHPEETLDDLLAKLQPKRGYAALDAEIRKQFLTGDVVRVSGWVLASTEARIAAVVALGG